MARILVIDDDVNIRVFFRQVLKRVGHEVIEAQDWLEGMRLFRRQRTDLVITDIFMPHKEGLETIRELKRDFPGIKIIAITGADVFMGADHVLGMAQTFGAIYVMKKPFNVAMLLDVVERSLNEGEAA